MWRVKWSNIRAVARDRVKRRQDAIIPMTAIYGTLEDPQVITQWYRDTQRSHSMSGKHMSQSRFRLRLYGASLQLDCAARTVH